MYKKEVKEHIKEFKKAKEENEVELRNLEVLEKQAPVQQNEIYTQQFIQKNVNMYTSEKAIDITLNNGPYKCTYTRNGSNMLVAGMNGYIAAFNTQKLSLGFEQELNDKIYDTKWLHNELYFATAQEDCVFVYDNTGSELHSVRDMKHTRMLTYLPYHFLLSGTTDNGHMNYLDTSIGEIVSSLFIGDKKPTVLTSNPANAVIHLGGASGCVSLWAPAQKSYLMKVKCHNSSITSIQIDRSGTNMVTTGLDRRIKVFDIRNTYKPLKTVQTKKNASCAALSDRGLLAIGYSDKIAVLKDYENLYMQHKISGVIGSLEFCKYEDILAIGHEKGFSTIVMPGAGDPAYHTTEDGPFITPKERKNKEVKQLLDKIPYDLISTTQVLGSVGKQNKKEFVMPQKRYYEEEKKPNALNRFYK